MVTQLRVLKAVHKQPLGVVTLTDPLPPAAGKAWPPALRAKVQGAEPDEPIADVKRRGSRGACAIRDRGREIETAGTCRRSGKHAGQRQAESRRQRAERDGPCVRRHAA